MTRESRKKIKILIVDQDASYAEATKKMLTREGYRAKAVTSLSSAVEEFKGDRYQIVLMDFAPDKEQAFDVMHEIRKIDDDVALIVMTTESNLDDALVALRAGCFDYRVKGGEHEMLDLIAHTIRNKGLVVDFEKKINLEIGKKIRLLRKERGLTLKQLANRTGLSISLISQIERAKSSSSVSTLYKVATALSVKMEYFFAGI